MRRVIPGVLVLASVLAAHTAGAATRFLDGNAPTAASAKCKDSGSINFAKGNPFSEIGTWSLAPRP